MTSIAINHDIHQNLCLLCQYMYDGGEGKDTINGIISIITFPMSLISDYRFFFLYIYSFLRNLSSIRLDLAKRGFPGNEL